jgi:hypothetical protein
VAGSLTRPNHFLILVYRMPAAPTANRVAVWRQLKKIGGIYLQQSVTAFPRVPRVIQDLQPLLRRIDESGGEYHLLPLRKLPTIEEAKLVHLFTEQATRHYDEIIENCEVNFTKEIEFETFRRNFTYEEAEEIRSEFEKIVSWYERVRERDWFGAPNQSDALRWLQTSQQRLEAFEALVYAAQSPETSGPGADLVARPSRPVTLGRRRRRQNRSLLRAPNVAAGLGRHAAGSGVDRLVALDGTSDSNPRLDGPPEAPGPDHHGADEQDPAG